eukprot:TRINITY_DN114240_c0_g1_i1.p1 TRINITY_DN114240_c0_g1~~TRINITY_DN114240_c0_g1_i1.p1  ORF type:complete len:498 (+),score=125.80 TRINITY_DN114240_c0_g1_i1:30-1496(+)
MAKRKEHPTDLDDFEVLECCDLEDFLRLLDIDPQAHEVDSHVMNAARSMYAAPLPPGWSEQVDEDSAYLYFYHKTTGESIWLHPQEAIFKELIAEVSKWHPDDKQDVITANVEAHMKQAQLAAADIIGNWSCAEVPDDGSGGMTQYYVNMNTGETSWADPRQSLEFDLWQRQYVLNTCKSTHIEKLNKPKMRLKPKPPPEPAALPDRNPQLSLQFPGMQQQDPNMGNAFAAGLNQAGWVAGFAAGLGAFGGNGQNNANPLAAMAAMMGAQGIGMQPGMPQGGYASAAAGASSTEDQVRNLGTNGLPSPRQGTTALKSTSPSVAPTYAGHSMGSMTPMSSTSSAWPDSISHVAGVRGFGAGVGLPQMELPAIDAFPPPRASAGAAPPSTTNRWMAHARYVNSQLKSDNFELTLLTMQVKKLNTKCVELDLQYSDRLSMNVERRELWTSMRAEYEALRSRSKNAMSKQVEELTSPGATLQINEPPTAVAN